MELIIGSFGGLGLLSALLPTVAHGPLGLLLLSVGIFTAVLYMWGTRRHGGSLEQSMLLTVAAAVLAYGIAYGCVWYFTSYLASQPNLLKFGSSVPTVTPTR